MGLPLLGVITTSKPYIKKLDPGCAADCGIYFIPGDGKSFFKLDTCAQLYRPQVISAAEIVKLSLAKGIKVIGNLPPMIANAMRNCLKRSEDVSAYHLSLLE